MLLHRHPGANNFGRIYGEPMFFFIGFMLARMFRKLRWTTQVRKTNLNNFKKCMLVYKNLHGLAPAYLLNEF